MSSEELAIVLGKWRGQNTPKRKVFITELFRVGSTLNHGVASDVPSSKEVGGECSHANARSAVIENPSTNVATG